MAIPTDNSTHLEHDSHSDSDWLDVASTDRDSDDNDSIYSSRETDHEDPTRSRSRRSSLSYGSSRDGDVDAWEGLIEDSADESLPNDVLAPSPHVASLSQPPATFDAQEASPDELRVKEALDQSMISTLSSSRSSSLHASTLHNSSRDLRLSFPDPITSSCREPLSTSYDEIQPNFDLPCSSADLDVPPVDDEEVPASSRVRQTYLPTMSIPSPSEPELRVFLYGLSTIFKWSIINKLLYKVVNGAGLSVNSDLETMQGSVRRLAISGCFERDNAFPRVITVFDRTVQPHDMAGDLALMDFNGVRPLAVVFMPCHPLDLPSHVLHLPIVPTSYSSELSGFGNLEAGSPRGAWEILNISRQQILRISAPECPSVFDKDSIDKIDSASAYRAFSHLWSSDSVHKAIINRTHALTIIAIISLILGLVLRAALPVSLQHFTPPTLATLAPNCTSDSFWQMLRPAPHRERLPPSTTLDSSVMVIPSSFRDLSLSVFDAESTSMMLSRANPTSFRRVEPPMLSERTRFSKDLILQPPCSVLLQDNRPKALSIIPETTPTSFRPILDTTGRAVSTPRDLSVPSVVKEYASVAYAMINEDMQDIFDALDALVQAISRQTQMVLAQATMFIEQSAMYLEKSAESLEAVKERLHAHNERARTRAKEIKEKGTKWLYDASEVVATGARFSQGMAWELAEGLTHRAQRARGKAKEMAAEIQEFLEHETLDVLAVDAWDSHTVHWDEWVQRVRKQGVYKSSCQRRLKKSIFC